LGTRAQKTHSKSFQAFSSINYPYLGVLRDGVLLQYIRPDSLPRPCLLRHAGHPGGPAEADARADRELLDFLLEHNDALIIESFGVGGLPDARRLLREHPPGHGQGKTVVLTTQVQNEGSDLTSITWATA
jgi:L-asparaginase